MIVNDFTTYKCVEKVNVSNLKRILANVRKDPKLITEMNDPKIKNENKMITQFNLLKNIQRKSKDTGQYDVEFFLRTKYTRAKHSVVYIPRKLRRVFKIWHGGTGNH